MFSGVCGQSTVSALSAALHARLKLLHLQRHLIQVVVPPDGGGRLLQHDVLIVAGVDHKVRGEGGLVCGEAPDAEAVDLYNEHCTLNYVLII